MDEWISRCGIIDGVGVESALPGLATVLVEDVLVKEWVEERTMRQHHIPVWLPKVEAEWMARAWAAVLKRLILKRILIRVSRREDPDFPQWLKPQGTAYADRVIDDPFEMIRDPVSAR